MSTTDEVDPLPPGVTREQVDEGRAWAADCMWKEDPEDIEQMTAEQVVRGVERHYDGGWDEMVRNAGLDEPQAGDEERG